jgi:hypothetical protein
MAKHAHTSGSPVGTAKSRSSDPHRDRPSRGRRWLRIGLAVLLALVTALCVWLSVEAIRAYRQRLAVREIRGLGGYTLRLHDRAQGEHLTPRWHETVFGGDFMNPVVAVRLAGTDADDEVLIRIGTFTRLVLLDLRDTRISDRGLAHLRRLNRLRVLILTGTEVSDKGLAELQDMPQLAALCLEETNVTDEGLRHLRGLTNLRWLDLGGTRITDASLMHLQECPSLQVLIVDRCHTSPEGVAAMERALPRTCVCDGTVRFPSIQGFFESLGGG